jgi:hypothetical protein
MDEAQIGADPQCPTCREIKQQQMRAFVDPLARSLIKYFTEEGLTVTSLAVWEAVASLIAAHRENEDLNPHLDRLEAAVSADEDAKDRLRDSLGEG